MKLCSFTNNGTSSWGLVTDGGIVDLGKRLALPTLRDFLATGDMAAVMDVVDVVVESSKVGVRKPEVRFYEIACEQLGVEPSACVFLDDLGINLKPAKAMGMTTIKVTGGHQALDELEAVLGISLR